VLLRCHHALLGPQLEIVAALDRNDDGREVTCHLIGVVAPSAPNQSPALFLQDAAHPFR
jgi:hypothetical protein